MISRNLKGLVAIIIASIFMGLVALPDSIKTNWKDSPFLNLFQKSRINLGLDLQGGTQLDYRIDLRNAEALNNDADSKNNVRIQDVIEGVRNTIERRVNGLGVSEPQIYLSNVGGESHIIVELAGIKDIEDAKKIVGKTIQLEFKEQKTEADPDETKKVRDSAAAVLKSAVVPMANFSLVGNNQKTSDKKIDFRENQTKFASELSEYYKTVLAELSPGQVHSAVIEGSDGYVVSLENKISEKKGLYIVQLISVEKDKERTIDKTKTFEEVAKELGKTLETQEGKKKADFSADESSAIFGLEANAYTKTLEAGDEYRVYKLLEKASDGKEKIRASHILVAYKGATRAKPEITRAKEEAKKLAEEILIQAKAGPEGFSDLAKQKSDDPTAAQNSGDLGEFGRGVMTKAFEDAAFGLAPGAISDVVETEFGFHVIRLIEKKAGEEGVKVQLLKMKKSEKSKADFDKIVSQTQSYKETVKEDEYKYSEIFFDLTPDPWKATGLDGSHFKRAAVTYGELGQPQVSIEFDSTGADLFETLTGRLVDKPLAIFVGGELISAPRVNAKISGGSAVITGDYSIKEALRLANDLNTGAIDAPVLLSGQYTISATLGESALKVSVIAGLVGLLVLALFMLTYYRLMGFFALIALSIYSIILLFVLKTAGIVLTLAGVAGVILSIGMAVDANILIFERSKEELRSGKNFTAAMAAGFERAWSSIRDSNVSSLITCAILWSFGNSIIRGFSLNLALGILISMFTAITVTRVFLQTVVGTSLTKNRFLLGVKTEEEAK